MTREQLGAICAELAATAGPSSRFNGLCASSSTEQSAGVDAVADPAAPLAFPFQAFTVDSEVRHARSANRPAGSRGPACLLVPARLLALPPQRSACALVCRQTCWPCAPA